MDLLINFYDNSLIYHPNLFFVTIFILSLLVFITGAIKVKQVAGDLKKYIESVRLEKGRKKDTRIYTTQLKSIFVSKMAYSIVALRIIFRRLHQEYKSLEPNIRKKIKKIELDASTNEKR